MTNKIVSRKVTIIRLHNVTSSIRLQKLCHFRCSLNLLNNINISIIYDINSFIKKIICDKLYTYNWVFLYLLYSTSLNAVYICEGGHSKFKHHLHSLDKANLRKHNINSSIFYISWQRNSSKLQFNTFFPMVSIWLFYFLLLVNAEFKNSVSIPWGTDIVCRNKQKRHYCVAFSIHCVRHSYETI